jgi:DNA-binding TFAR19-related protein (PDSD5 family)
MNDDELLAIRLRKMRELQQRQTPKGGKLKILNADEALYRVFRGRALEIFKAASYQFPDAMSRVKEVLVRLASSGEIAEVGGEELYFFLRKLGLNVRLNTKINYASHGQLKPLAERMKEELQNPAERQ